MQYPESLLLEIESGIMIRENQELIAREMRAPPDDRNAVMQLLMGEGKSSVIIPIVAAYLADGQRLVRVLVTKAQAKELWRILVAKLGGLLEHRIFHLPFCRSLRPTAADMEGIYSMIKECKASGGVLLVQPEHILSFQLMAIEKQLTGHDEAGESTYLDLQHFFNSNSRDLVDESDENFSVKFEVIYTMGEQRHIEFSPLRWTLIQCLLTSVADAAPAVQKQLPESIEVSQATRGQFPRIRILRQDALDLLLDDLLQTLSSDGLPGFPLSRQSIHVRKRVLTYISRPILSANQINDVEENAGLFTGTTRDALLLLRGLFAGGLLSHALGQKRWRVNYGITHGRRPPTRLAVPYRAKDCPAPRSEFSHTDVVIILTCLCFYYQGLSDDELFLSFEHLIHFDRDGAEYSSWVKDSPKLPETFRRIDGVNLKDCALMVDNVFPHIRRSKAVVDYFLSHIVFPKEMREFPQKLSASGWDIGKRRSQPTTGFSGTNDSRHTLPLDVKYLDLETQKHTNALVINNLLRSENSVASMPRRNETMCSDAIALLQFVVSMDRSVEVILDVGAQILELTNIEVASAWLEMVPPERKKEAVVFFNDDDEICVINRYGQVEHLHASSYAQQLDMCLVFLDEAHTRGTDLKLPVEYRAAVTLGAYLTKDKLVQACMRMRKLGQGQSVVFCISEEIKGKIRAYSGTPFSSEISVSDVLLWAFSETHADIRRELPLWAMQGARFECQKEVWSKITTIDGICMTKSQAEKFLEKEAQSLEDRYRPGQVANSGSLVGDAGLSSANPRLVEIEKRCQTFNGVVDYKSSALQEEQERELSPEIEQERQVEKPAEVAPERHALHPHIRDFVATGAMLPSSPAFAPAFRALKGTSAAKLFDLDQFSTDLLVTADYIKTVKMRGVKTSADWYQRPVQWILSTTEGGQNVRKLVIISPYEAQELLSQLMGPSVKVNLHLYAPRTNAVFPARDDLKFYTVPVLEPNWTLPSHLKQLLNVYAGQLYFTTFADYRDTCDILSLAWHPTLEGMIVHPDGYISQREDGNPSQFEKSPVKFLGTLLSGIRRDCRRIEKTHWGRVLGGELLTESDFH
ncbi:hypothetical protein HIM_10079 [Hirsutella minnesotensis 3608]|uniref:ubiquitinyl hydrolase 1 n=1 Tax=Hirsutella minnesotensis 3608 TaxID=1043627 RepID=A0A0F7ZKG4_9HYPO|nr:hypothetical protein HIM_10079 [Hirsutella minnesotensis 3608]